MFWNVTSQFFGLSALSLRRFGVLARIIDDWLSSSYSRDFIGGSVVSSMILIGTGEKASCGYSAQNCGEL
jgi:hypothetical protein